MRRAGKGGPPPSRRAERPHAAPPAFSLMDTHCHLDHMEGAEALAAAAERRLGICCATVAPAEYRAARERFAGCPNVCVGAGLHPWWLADGRCTARDVDALVLELARAPFVAEVGLDFSEARKGTAALQLTAFECIVQACAERPLHGRVLSIHAVHAAGDVIDVLERYDLPRIAGCIFHWFSGTSEDLARARRLGCYFSVNERMLRTRRGRAYAQAIPEERLLLETDAPPVFDGPYTLEEWMRSLDAATNELALIRTCDPVALASTMAQTSRALFAGCFGDGRPVRATGRTGR